jgi:hypothetical protein
MYGVRTTVPATEADARKLERDRVAWNLPRAKKHATARSASDAPRESGELRDSTHGTAENG